MEIELKWDDFLKPSKDDIIEFNSLYKDFNNNQLVKIKTRNQIYESDLLEKKLDFLFNRNKELKIIAEIDNHINISSFYIKHLWFYSKKKPNRFKGGIRTSSSIYFETYFEIVFSKLYSCFDRYLQLIRLYFNFQLELKDVTKNKIKDSFKSEYLNTSFEEIITDKSFNKILKIRNSFIHRENIFEKNHKINQDGLFYDNFQYKNQTDLTIKVYIDFIFLLNSKAIPFLYEFKNHLEQFK